MATQALKSYLESYQRSHQNPLNKKIHMICVPLIEWSLLGLLWGLPRPLFFGSVNWAILFVGLGLLFYSRFRSVKVVLGAVILMLPFWLYISFSPPFIWQTSAVVFAVAWIGQFYGHKVEGQKPSFFEDLFFLLIGPLWVIESFLRARGKSLV